MSFNFNNLDKRTRDLMVDEVDYDIANGKLYLSPRLKNQGIQEYENRLKNAIQNGNETTLAADLRSNGLLKQFEIRNTRSGPKRARVPINAHETLAEGEFNRYYIRALCRRVIEEKTGRLEVYRAKQVSNPRTASQAKIGEMMDSTDLLTDLRNNPGVDTALGLPPGPNSGLSVQIVN